MSSRSWWVWARWWRTSRPASTGSSTAVTAPTYSPVFSSLRYAPPADSDDYAAISPTRSAESTYAATEYIRTKIAT